MCTQSIFIAETTIQKQKINPISASSAGCEWHEKQSQNGLLHSHLAYKSIALNYI